MYVHACMYFKIKEALYMFIKCKMTHCVQISSKIENQIYSKSSDFNILPYWHIYNTFYNVYIWNTQKICETIGIDHSRLTGYFFYMITFSLCICTDACLRDPLLKDSIDFYLITISKENTWYQNLMPINMIKTRAQK